jgi:hypothetical protein
MHDDFSTDWTVRGSNPGRHKAAGTYSGPLTSSIAEVKDGRSCTSVPLTCFYVVDRDFTFYLLF